MRVLNAVVMSIVFYCVEVDVAKSDHKYKRIASDKYLHNICLEFANPVSDAWHSSLRKAVRLYNNAFRRNTKLGFCYNSSYTTSPYNASYVIQIFVENYGNTGWKADSEFPSRRGLPGSRIRVNTYYTRDPDSMVSTIMHELGHNLGIMHTDERSGKTVPGLQGQDSASIFRDATGTHLLPRFTRKDILAITNLYR